MTARALLRFAASEILVRCGDYCKDPECPTHLTSAALRALADRFDAGFADHDGDCKHDGCEAYRILARLEADL
jgi:hypothetical protein